MSKTITTTYSARVTLTSPSYDPTTITSTGLLQDGLTVLYHGAWQVLNQGTVQGSSHGVYLYDGGTVTNQDGGYIGGAAGGIYALHGALTVANHGSIYSSDNDAILLADGGSVTNQANSVISGDTGGIEGAGAAVTVVNAGTIISTAISAWTFSPVAASPIKPAGTSAGSRRLPI
jgi:hypothetical protein